MERSRPEHEERGGYLQWSREPAVGLVAVLPLWLVYEALRLWLATGERNGAEALISEAVRLLGPTAFIVLRVAFAGAVIAATVSIVRRGIPWLQVTLVTALEGLVYALALGPIAAALERSSARVLGAQVRERGLLDDVAASLGAGIFEELLFRLVLLSVLALLLIRAARAFGLPRTAGVVAALIISALLFSLFHHLGPGAAPFTQRAFVFRAIAGAVLGTIFVLRGFGACVYAHALYDVHYYLLTE